MAQHAKASTSRLPIEGDLPSLDGATGWINTEALTPATLKGKVVLVQFWTLTCINWLRTLPYVRAWSEKYKDRFVVVGVHTPEFDFEKNIDNVRRAVAEMRIAYPVAVDSGYAIWRAFDNQYWPALYFIDARGQIRHHQFGEGAYDESEKVIQELLADAGASPAEHGLVADNGRGIEAAADWRDLQSAETYVGYARGENLASPEGPGTDKRQRYTLPARLLLNQWGLGGEWTMGPQALTLNTPGGRIAYRFHARDLHLVMGAAAKGTRIRFRVLLDGKPPGKAHGIDVDDDGNGTLAEQRLYQLIRQPAPIADRQFEITFLDPGAEAFVFTFG